MSREEMLDPPAGLAHFLPGVAAPAVGFLCNTSHHRQAHVTVHVGSSYLKCLLFFLVLWLLVNTEMAHVL